MPLLLTGINEDYIHNYIPESRTENDIRRGRDGISKDVFNIKW